MDDDDSSIELVYEDLPSPKVKEENTDDISTDEENVSPVSAGNRENSNDMENGEFNQDKDPLGLLKLLDKQTPEEDHQESKNANDDEEHGSKSTVSSAQMRIHLIYEWCFKEPDSDSVWCLYCNSSLKFATRSYLNKHQAAQSHRERKIEYVGFLNQMGSDEYRLFSNRDFDGDLQEAKQHRQSLENDFVDFLWDKWEADYEWLLRTDVRFYAYCKYCHHNVIAGSSYQRKVHEESTKHREFKKKAPKRRATVCGDMQGLQTEDLTSDGNNSQGKENENLNNFNMNSKWYEKSKTSSDLCRCKLCDITLFCTSFYKHTTSNLHRQNLSAFDNPGVSEKLVKPDWENIKKDHEWLMEDPIDSMEGYCKYCKKRLLYGSSAAKRLIHEHSHAHRAAVQKFNNPLPYTGENDGDVDKENENARCDENGSGDNSSEEGDNENIAESLESNEAEDTDSKSGKRKKRRNSYKSKALKERYPWVKNYIKDARYYVCQYCKVLLRKKHFNGKKHQETSRHQQALKQYQEQTGQNVLVKGNNLLKNKIRYNKTHYPWLMTLKSDIDYLYCTYCDLKFSRKTKRSNHQKTQRHLEAEKIILAEAAEKNKGGNKNRLKLPQKAVKIDEECERQSPIATQTELKIMKARIAELQKKFVWLRYEKGLLFNYAFCSYCEKSVYMTGTGYALKHSKTLKHIRARNEKMKDHQFEISAYCQSAEDSESEKSSTNSFEMPAKPSKPSSMQTAIETAKRLSAAHLKMLTFMKKNVQNKSDLMQRLRYIETPQENSIAKPLALPPPPPSPSVDLNASIPISRDPFDLFFTSISESIKRLPADLASEGKLKVMQIIFDLEIRAQQRQNQSEVVRTPNTNLNGSIPNSTTDDAIIDLMDIDEDLSGVKEILTNSPITQPATQQHQQKQPQQQIHHQQQQQNQQNNPFSNNYIRQVTPQKNSILQQQLAQPHQPPPMPNLRNYVVQNQSQNTSSQSGNNYSATSPAGPKSNMTIKATSFVGSDQVQRNSTSQQHSKNPNLYNYNQRFNNNNTSISYTATTPTSASPITTSSPNRQYASNANTIIHNARNNNGNQHFLNKMPIIRPVALSSLTLKKYLKRNESANHHIHLNSSTQSKIIPLDPKGQSR